MVKVDGGQSLQERHDSRYISLISFNCFECSDTISRRGIDILLCEKDAISRRESKGMFHSANVPRIFTHIECFPLNHAYYLMARYFRINKFDTIQC